MRLTAISLGCLPAFAKADGRNEEVLRHTNAKGLFWWAPAALPLAARLVFAAWALGPSTRYQSLVLSCFPFSRSLSCNKSVVFFVTLGIIPVRSRNLTSKQDDVLRVSRELRQPRRRGPSSLGPWVRMLVAVGAPGNGGTRKAHNIFIFVRILPQSPGKSISRTLNCFLFSPSNHIVHFWICLKSLMKKKFREIIFNLWFLVGLC